jgi:hypothetical protein
VKNLKTVKTVDTDALVSGTLRQTYVEAVRGKRTPDSSIAKADEGNKAWGVSTATLVHELELWNPASEDTVPPLIDSRGKKWHGGLYETEVGSRRSTPCVIRCTWYLVPC